MLRSLFKEIAGNVRACGTTLIVSDLLFKAVTLLLLTPLISLLFRLFVLASGRTVLADADIARFLLHPLGWLAFVLVGGAVLCMFVLEQAMSAMISRGVDNLITDYPDVARRILAERQEMSPIERLMVELAFYLGVKPPVGGMQ